MTPTPPSGPDPAERAAAARSRLALLVLACAAAALLAAGLHGIGSPFISGHYGYHGGEYATRARHTIRHGSILPWNVPSFLPPKPEDYYLHHPILTHQLATATLVLFGDHESSVRAAGLLACLACFLLLARLVWVHWGPWSAALAGGVFVVVPIDVWYGNHIDQGYPSIGALLAFFLSYLRWLRVGRWRDAAAALAFAALAGGFEWSPYLVAVPTFVHAIATGFARRGRFAAFAPLYAVAVALPLVAHGLISWRTGHLPEMLESYRVRTAGGLDQAFYSRSYDIAVAMFGKPLLLAAALWLLLVLGRLMAGRGSARDLVGLSFSFALFVYVQVFRAGVLIHPYRYLYGGVVCAIAACDLAAWLSSGTRALLRRHNWAGAAQAAVASAVGVGLVGATLPLSYRALLESRRTGGVPFSGAYDPDTKKIAFAELVRDQTRPGDMLYLHASFTDYHRGLVYYLDRDQQASTPLQTLLTLSPAMRSRALLLCVPRALSPAERELLGQLAREHPIWLVSGYLLVDFRQTGAAARAQQAVPPRHRSALARYWEGPYPRLRRAPDPNGSAELVQLGLRPQRAR